MKVSGMFRRPVRTAKDDCAAQDSRSEVEVTGYELEAALDRIRDEGGHVLSFSIAPHSNASYRLCITWAKTPPQEHQS